MATLLLHFSIFLQNQKTTWLSEKTCYIMFTHRALPVQQNRRLGSGRILCMTLFSIAIESVFMKRCLFWKEKFIKTLFSNIKIDFHVNMCFAKQTLESHKKCILFSKTKCFGIATQRAFSASYLFSNRNCIKNLLFQTPKSILSFATTRKNAGIQ